MRKIAVLTNADIGKLSGNMSLVLRRAKALYDIKGCITEICVYKRNCTDTNANEWLKYKNIDGKKSLSHYLVSEKPDMLLFYGDKMSLLIPWAKRTIKKFKLPTELSLDIQGAVEEKKEYPLGPLSKLKYPLIYFAFIQSLMNINSAFVVSDELEQNCRRKTPFHGEKLRFYKVRCGCNDVLDYSEILFRRKMIREKIGISEESWVFTFSGFRAPWQKIDKTIEVLKEIDRELPNVFFLFLCNQDQDFSSKLKQSFPKGNYYSSLCSVDDYINFLCASNVGMLIRDYNETNKVAFPNKFSDYLMTGQLMFINGSLPEPFRILKQYRIPSIDIEEDFIPTLLCELEQIRKNEKAWYELNRLACSRELLYNEQIKKIAVFDNLKKQQS